MSISEGERVVRPLVMSKFSYRRRRKRVTGRLAAAVAVVLLLRAAPLPAAADDWRPITKSDLELGAPKVEEHADAEAIFWEVWVSDVADYWGVPRTVMTHYLRIKVFTPRGVESQSTVDIPYSDNDRVKHIEARTIKPDGSVVELGKDAIFERGIVKADGLKLKAKSFVMPGVEPGSIIEYRWTEIHTDQLASYVRLDFQRDIPVQFAKYYLKPLRHPSFPFSMRGWPFYAQPTPIEKEDDGYYSTTMSHVPAFREEPYMPPEIESRPWMLIYYSDEDNQTPDEFWREYGKELYREMKSRMKVKKDIRKAATLAVQGVSMPDERLERLFDFVRERIRNIDDDSLKMTDDARKKLKKNMSPSDTLKRGYGTHQDINLLFAALARSVGFDARYTVLADRSRSFFNPRFKSAYFLSSYQHRGSDRRRMALFRSLQPLCTLRDVALAGGGTRRARVRSRGGLLRKDARFTTREISTQTTCRAAVERGRNPRGQRSHRVLRPPGPETEGGQQQPVPG